jgi:hypothetical protein
MKKKLITKFEISYENTFLPQKFFWPLSKKGGLTAPVLLGQPLEPVLSYFAKFLAGWQLWLLPLLSACLVEGRGGGGAAVT